MRHLLLRDYSLHGFQYGMLRDLEDEIVRVNAGAYTEIPARHLPKLVDRRLRHGMRYAPLRPFIPKAKFDLKCDVLWLALMGPEDYRLDLFARLGRRSGTKILYIFDTFEQQMPSLRRVLKSTDWDLTVTSFHGAVPLLEKETQRKWYAVPQGVKADRFRPAPRDARLIGFSSFGRRCENVHQSIASFCGRTNKHYEYTTALAPVPDLDPRENYRQYAWHLAHSTFTFCWPVEMTHPARVRTFSPITCRWFEAAASGTVMVGRAPSEPEFEKIFGPQAVIPVDAEQSPKELDLTWERIWGSRVQHLEAAANRRQELLANWTWENRVNAILRLAKLL